MDGIKQEFMDRFEEEYPRELLEWYIPIECLSRVQYGTTLLVKGKSDGKRYVAKCYEEKHPLFSSTEPEALRKLKYPGIPAYAGECRDEHMRCIVREYIEGETLEQLSRQERFTQKQIISIGEQLCDILMYLHSQNPAVIHRDIKPQNVIIKKDNTVVLIDFGISRLFNPQEEKDTVFCGTHDFAAPEQYGFEQTGPGSDIYSLGVLLTWLLTGKTDSIKEPETCLEQVLKKSTSFSPENRYKNAKCFRRALRGAGLKKQRERFIRGQLVTAAIILLLVSFLFLWKEKREMGIRFQEPVIELAVREICGKPSNSITREDMEKIEELYIMRDKIYPDRDSYYSADQGDTLERGTITTLADLEGMKNLRVICIGGEHITDITAISKLEQLEQVELRFNEVKDISSLEGKKKLVHVGLNGNPTVDLTPLKSCPLLQSLDLRNADEIEHEEILDNFTRFGFLDLVNESECYQYLSGKTVQLLKLGGSRLVNLECIRQTDYIGELDISYSGITDISALSGRTDIFTVRLQGCAVRDLSSLYSMENLQTVTADETMRTKFQAQGENQRFTIEYID